MNRQPKYLKQRCRRCKRNPYISGYWWQRIKEESHYRILYAIKDGKFKIRTNRHCRGCVHVAGVALFNVMDFLDILTRKDSHVITVEF